jgi:Tol biopolymer transport system component
MHGRKASLGVLAGVVLMLVAAVPFALAASIPQRTAIGSIQPDGGPANGGSQDPVLSNTGRVLAFDTTATNLAGVDGNGPIRDVVAIDLATNERRLVSSLPDGTGGNGFSSNPAMSGNGQVIAFVSAATNFASGDTNGVPDVFVREGREPLVRASVATGGAPANGVSFEPDISAEGTRVVFTSTASNLVPGDTNGQADVFMRDLPSGTTIRVSVSDDGVQADGRSMSPSISADGRYVAFTSAASNLVPSDSNSVTDVFVRDLKAHTTERVSISTRGRQQNKSVTPPFVQISDISDNGRYVVFDSDATNLYAGDINRRTDVFMHDRAKNTTSLISASSANVQGNNDSFAPRLSPRGRYVSFQSFATNLAPGDGPREDIFVRDLRLGTTSVVSVTANGAPREPERVPQLLQRPSISADGRFAAFSSTVPNLAMNDTNGDQDVFLRFLDAPVTRIISRPPRDRSGTVRLGADDPLATSFVCQIDNQRQTLCPSTFPIKRGVGKVLKVRAGGPGMLFDDDTANIRLSDDNRRPRVTISRPRGRSIRVIRGRAADASGIRRVDVAVSYGTSKGCRYLVTRTRFTKRSTRAACSTVVFVRANGKRNWSLRLPHAVRGNYVILALATDGVGNRSQPVNRQGRIG